VRRQNEVLEVLELESLELESLELEVMELESLELESPELEVVEVLEVEAALGRVIPSVRELPAAGEHNPPAAGRSPLSSNPFGLLQTRGYDPEKPRGETP
jgi:hypothetical protein